VRSTSIWPIEVLIEPRSSAECGRLGEALARIAAQDVRFGCATAPDDDAVIAKVVDERDIGLLIDILGRAYRLEVLVGAPEVAYRETVARATEVDYSHKRQLGGRGSFARVKLRLEPNEAGAGNAFASEIVGGVVPEAYIPGIEKGVQAVWDAGVLIGFPMVDMKVTLVDGAYHELDSSMTAFEIAARAAMREGGGKAGVRLLEPIMDVEVTAPSDLAGGVIADLEARRGRIDGRVTLGFTTALRAYAPIVRLLGYRCDLEALTEGLGTCAMRFSHYAETPPPDGPGTFRPAVGMRA
jgi:elongation factor G